MESMDSEARGADTTAYQSRVLQLDILPTAPKSGSVKIPRIMTVMDSGLV